jgi:hypothetical protein
MSTSYTTADIGPALDLLESTKKIGREPAVAPNTARAGWLAGTVLAWSSATHERPAEFVPEPATELVPWELVNPRSRPTCGRPLRRTSRAPLVRIIAGR